MDREGFIFPLAIGALALIFFSWYFLSMSSRNKQAMENSIQSVEDLNAASKDLDSQDPDAFKTDLDANSVDSRGL